MRTYLTEIKAASGRIYAGEYIKARSFAEAQEIAGPDLKVIGRFA